MANGALGKEETLGLIDASRRITAWIAIETASDQGFDFNKSQGDAQHRARAQFGGHSPTNLSQRWAVPPPSIWRPIRAIACW
jgi:hypothetical protein